MYNDTLNILTRTLVQIHAMREQSDTVIATIYTLLSDSACVIVNPV